MKGTLFWRIPAGRDSIALRWRRRPLRQPAARVGAHFPLAFSPRMVETFVLMYRPAPHQRVRLRAPALPGRSRPGPVWPPRLAHGAGKMLGALAAMAAFLGPFVSTARAGTCVGDCNGDGSVLVNELVEGVGVALGDSPVSVCRVFDASGDGQVGIDELVAGVANALGGCPGGAASRFGQWSTREGLPAFVYDADQDTLPEAEWDPLLSPPTRRHWVMLGNRAIQMQVGQRRGSRAVRRDQRLALVDGPRSRRNGFLPDRGCRWEGLGHRLLDAGGRRDAAAHLRSDLVRGARFLPGAHPRAHRAGAGGGGAVGAGARAPAARRGRRAALDPARGTLGPAPALPQLSRDARAAPPARPRGRDLSGRASRRRG